MIKKNAQGKVIEFEDDAVMASLKGAKIATIVSATGETVLTEEQALAEYEADIKTAEAEALASLKAVVIELGGEVAKLDAASAVKKKKIKETRKAAIDKANRDRGIAVKQAEKAHEQAREAIIVDFREMMRSINVKLEASKLAVEEVLLKVKAAVLVKHKARLFAIAQAKNVDAKLKVVAAAQETVTQGSENSSSTVV